MRSNQKGRALRVAAGAVVAAGVLTLGCGRGEQAAAPQPGAEAESAPAAGDATPAAANADTAALRAKARAIFGVLPAEAPNPNNPVTPQKVDLGRMLFFEPRITLSGKLSCNSCHQLDRYGVDNEPTSAGHEGQRGERNSPTRSSTRRSTSRSSGTAARPTSRSRPRVPC